MLRLVVARGAGGMAWTGSPETAAGMSFVGPEHLHDALALRLGVAPRRAPIERVLRCADALESTPGAWSESLALAPLSTAATLLREADALALWGARRDDLCPRLAARLAVAWESDPPEVYLDAVASAVGCAALRGAVTLVDDPDSLPRRVRDLLDALARQGWTVAPTGTPPGPVPEVLHLRDRTPVALAQRLAAALVREAPASTVVIAPTPSLAMAFAQHGLPSLGDLRRDDRVSSLLGALLALARGPDDIARVREIVDHPLLPTPPALRRALVDALAKWPSHRAPTWRDAIRRAPDAVAAEAIDALVAEASSAPEEVFARWRAFARWIAPADGARAIDATVDLLKRLAITDLSAPRVDDALRVVATALRPTPASVPEAGAAALRHPGAVLGPVDHLVVWGASAQAPSPDPLSALGATAREELRARGIALPSAAHRRREHLRDLLRAIAHTRARVWLCDADTDEEGSGAGDGAVIPWLDAALRARGGLGVVQCISEEPTAPAPRPAPRPRRRWQVTTSARPRTESPSSLSTLLGCPLRHALRYHARLHDDAYAPLPDGPLLYGRVAHEVLADALLPLADGTSVSARTAARFDAFVAAHASTLLLPARRPSLHRLRARTVRAGALLATHLAEAVTDVSTERSLRPSSPFGPVRLQGRADLVTRAPAMVLDLKWSASGHARALAEGTALQLALYAWALRDAEGGAWPAVGYVILDDGEVFVTDPAPLPRARAVRSVAVERTVDAAQRAVTRVIEARAAGELVAEGVPDGTAPPPSRDALDGETLRVAPACRYCAFEGLCGRAWQEGAR